MTISNLIGSRLLTGIATFALSGSLLGGTAMAAQQNSPVREIRHEVRDQSKAQREEIKQLRDEFAAEYAKQRPDTAKLARLQGAIEAKRSEIAAMRFDALMKMHDELDAEQRRKMAGRHDERGERGSDGAKGKGKGKHAKGKHAKGHDAGHDRPDNDKRGDGEKRGPRK